MLIAYARENKQVKGGKSQNTISRQFFSASHKVPRWTYDALMDRHAFASP